MPEAGLARQIKQRALCFLVAAAAAAVAPSAARAVIVYGDQGRNTTAPNPGDVAYPAWQLQGNYGAYLFTPIAPNLGLVASHIGAPVAGQSVTFQGQSYLIDQSFNKANHGLVKNPDTDLGIIRVNGTFPAYAPLFTDINTDAVPGKQLVLIGKGTQRGPEVTVGGVLKGWEWGPFDGVQSWGTNTMAGYAVDDQQRPAFLAFDFSPNAGVSEGTVSAGDSGGGLFMQDGTTWKLVGVNFGVDLQFSADPSGSPLLNPAAIFDTTSLYLPNGNSYPAPSAFAYSSRVSYNMPFLNKYLPIIQSSYTVGGTVDVGDVEVSGLTLVQGTGHLQTSHVRGGTLQIDSGGSVMIEPNGTSFGVSKVSTLAIAPGGKLDLTDNRLIVQATAGTRDAVLNQVNAWVAQGRNAPGGLWQGDGITTSIGPTQPTMTLGVAPNWKSNGGAFFTTFGGQAVDANSVLVRYTLAGDLNLDGKINEDDYFAIDLGVANQLTGYWHGDVNYSGGQPNGDDFFLMDQGFLSQPAPAAAGGEALPLDVAAGTVPEPGTIGLMIGSLGAGLLARRSRRH
jgi:hypothetical protein